MIGVNAPVFGRVITAMVTPFADDLSIDYKAVAAIVEHLIATGTDAIVVSGTTGESPTLEDQEKKDLAKSVISAAKGKAKIILGAGYNSTKKTIEACKQAESLGVDGLLLVAPYYNKPSQAGLLAHFDATLKSTSLPTIIYNIPGRTGININVETVVELASNHPNLHALKDSTGGVDQTAEIASKARSDFRIYSGDDYLTLPFLSVGACGVISVASHVVGSQISAMIDAFMDGDHATATQLHGKYLSLFKGLFLAPNPACVKYVLSKLGLCKAHLRLPLVGPSSDQIKTLDTLITECQLLESLRNGSKIAAGASPSPTVR